MVSYSGIRSRLHVSGETLQGGAIYVACHVERPNMSPRVFALWFVDMGGGFASATMGEAATPCGSLRHSFKHCASKCRRWYTNHKDMPFKTDNENVRAKVTGAWWSWSSIFVESPHRVPISDRIIFDVCENVMLQVSNKVVYVKAQFRYRGNFTSRTELVSRPSQTLEEFVEWKEKRPTYMLEVSYTFPKENVW